MEIKDLKVGDEIWYFQTKEGNSFNRAVKPGEIQLVSDIIVEIVEDYFIFFHGHLRKDKVWGKTRMDAWCRLKEDIGQWGSIEENNWVNNLSLNEKDGRPKTISSGTGGGSPVSASGGGGAPNPWNFHVSIASHAGGTPVGGVTGAGSTKSIETNITELMPAKKDKRIICLYTDNEGNLFSSSDEKIGILFPKVAKP